MEKAVTLPSTVADPMRLSSLQRAAITDANIHHDETSASQVMLIVPDTRLLRWLKYLNVKQSGHQRYFEVRTV
jgi:hypothetical protein